jgi:hypothetical protein
MPKSKKVTPKKHPQPLRRKGLLDLPIHKSNAKKTPQREKKKPPLNPPFFPP